MQLHWIYDVYFALPEIWETIFKPFGIEFRPVFKQSTRQPLKTVVQLVPQGTVSTDLELDGYPFELCPRTGRKKYLPVTKGFFPRFKDPTVMNYFISREDFGSGASASKAVFVDNQLFKVIRNNKLRGVSFTPLIK
jgi:hypothetical protein